MTVQNADSLARFDSLDIVLKDTSGNLLEVLFQGDPVELLENNRRVVSRYGGGTVIVSVRGFASDSLAYSRELVYDGSTGSVTSAATLISPWSRVSIDETLPPMAIGSARSLPAVTVTPKELRDTSVTWISTNPSAAKIEGDTEVVAVAAGQTRIIVFLNADPAKRDTAELTVSGSLPPDPPRVTAPASPTRDATPSFTWMPGASGGAGIFRWKLDDSLIASWADTGNQRHFTPETDLAEGPHVLYVQEQNADGIWSESGEARVTVDLTGPKPPAVSAGASPVNDATPGFSWEPGGNGAGVYRWRLDSEAMGPDDDSGTAVSFAPAEPLAEGRHTLYVRERDSAGNWSDAGSAEVFVDLTPPIAPSVTPPPSPTPDETPTFAWASGGGGAGIFAWKMDDSLMTTGADTGSALTYTPTGRLAEGAHTLYVRERDAAGNWSAAGSAPVTVDKTAPNVPAVFGPASPSNDPKPKFTWTSGGGAGYFRWKLENSDFSEGGDSGTALSFIPAAPLPEGAHIFFVQEQDAARNWSSAGFAQVVLDFTAPGKPVVKAPASPSNDATPSFTWESGGGGAGFFRWKLDDSVFAAGVDSGAVRSFTPAKGLSEGNHFLYVQERDMAGNWSPAGMGQVTLDLTSPAPPTMSAMTTPSTDPAPTFSWSSGGGSGFYRWKLDDSVFVVGVDSGTVKTFTPAASLPEGPHTLYVQERDASGNWSATAKSTVTLDYTPPLAPKVEAPASPSNDSTPTFTWTAGGGGVGTYRCKLNDSDLAVGSTTTTNAEFTPAAGLRDGSHILYVQEQDAAGLWSPLGKDTVVLDLTPPPMPIPSAPDSSIDSRPTWTWNSAGGGGGYRCKLDDSLLASAATISAVTFTPASGLADGAHTLYVQERDAAGNWSATGKKTVQVYKKILLYDYSASGGHVASRDSLRKALQRLQSRYGFVLEMSRTSADLNAAKLAGTNVLIFAHGDGAPVPAGSLRTDVETAVRTQGKGMLLVHAACAFVTGWDFFQDACVQQYWRHNASGTQATVYLDSGIAGNGSHGLKNPVTAPLLQGLPVSSSYQDEWWTFTASPRTGSQTGRPVANLSVLLSLDETTFTPPVAPMGDHPIVWTHDMGGGRVIVHTPGHDDVWQQNDPGRAYGDTLLWREILYLNRQL